MVLDFIALDARCSVRVLSVTRRVSLLANGAAADGAT